MFKSRLASNSYEINKAIELATEIFRTKGEKLTDELIEIQKKITNPFGLLSQNDVVVLMSPTEEVCGTIFLVDRLLFNPSIELKATYLSSICVSEKHFSDLPKGFNPEIACKIRESFFKISFIEFSSKDLSSEISEKTNIVSLEILSFPLIIIFS